MKSFAAAFLFFILCRCAQAETSALWGTNGELWSPRSRLPDFSYAGYHSGEASIPDVEPGVSVKKFGARGDGVTDDTQAFQTAIRHGKGSIEIPPGRYVISDVLEIKRSGVVLRGTGADQTVLYFPKAMEQIRPKTAATTDGLPTTAWSWSGGLIWFQGYFEEKVLTDISDAAERGDTSLRVKNTSQLRTGQRLEIFERDEPDNSLATELYSGDPGKVANLKGSTKAKMVVRLLKVETNQITFDRPLRFAVKTQWHPQIRSFEPSVTEAGIENLRIEFPQTPYAGHFKEAGFNALAFSGVSDCWARNLVISNADSGIFASGNFCSFTNIQITSSRPQDGQKCTGHHGTSFDGADNLFTQFDYHTRFIHDISVESSACGNVFSHGRGVDLCFDHHERAPFENLFSDIDAGAGSRLWHCGGGAALGKHSGARETFWNIRAKQQQELPPQSFGPASMNFIALQTGHASVKNLEGQWLEAISPENIFPPDLHSAQLSARLARTLTAH